MATPPDNISMALFCDFENVALGVRDAQFEKFDIKPILERLLLKGSIVVKKAYCDWDRYKGFKATMHEANFELIEIPHVRQSGKNSADIRLVVDALDLCYTKSHVNTFVIISGDSDFSPLVSKLRENNKQVIGVGVKQSTSDLLIANCDEFIFYDDLVRENQRALARRQNPGSTPAPRRTPEEERHRRETHDVRRTQGVELAVETFEALVSERGDSGKIWASVLKEAIKRRKPDFSESYYGFRTFGNLLEDAQERGLLEFGRDEKSGAYVFRSHGAAAASAPVVRAEAAAERQGSAGYFRHDFHAVATVPELPAATSGGDGDGGDVPTGRSRGRRGQSRSREEANNAQRAQEESRDSVPADALAERPAGGYFNQTVVAAAPLDDGVTTPASTVAAVAAVGPHEVREVPEVVEAAGSHAQDSQAPRKDAAPASGRNGRSRSSGGAKSRSAGKVSAPAASVEPAAATPPASPSEPASPEASGAASDKAVPARPRSGARKPAAKSAK